MGKAVRQKTLKLRFGSCSFGKGTVGLSFSINRTEFPSIDAADELLTHAQLHVRATCAVANGHKDAAGQQTIADTDHVLEAIAECSRISVGVDTITGRLSFPKGDTDERDILHASFSEAKATLKRTGSIEKASKGEGADDADDEEIEDDE